MPHSPHMPRIFVSHSHHDNDFGIQLVVDLKRTLGDDDAVWYDKAGGLIGGDAWWRRIVEEITARDTFLVILSPDAVASEWVTDEIDIAWKQKNASGKRIIPVLYSPCTVREDLSTRQIVSFVAPRPYAQAFAELCTALDLPAGPAGAGATPHAEHPAPIPASPGPDASLSQATERHQVQNVQHAQLRPALYPLPPISSPIVNGNLDWNLDGIGVQIRNAGAGDALNIFGQLFAPKPVESIVGPRYTLWQSPPLAPGAERAVRMPIGMTLIDGDTQIGSYTFYPPPRPSQAEIWRQGTPVVLARLVLTYHDIFGTKHASMSDFTQRHGWKHLAFLADIPADIEDLDRRAR